MGARITRPAETPSTQNMKIDIISSDGIHVSEKDALERMRQAAELAAASQQQIEEGRNALLGMQPGRRGRGPRRGNRTPGGRPAAWLRTTWGTRPVGQCRAATVRTRAPHPTATILND